MLQSTSDTSNHSTCIVDYGEKGFVLEVNDKFKGVFKTKEDAVQAYVDIRIGEEESKGRPIKVLVIDEVQSKRHQDAKEIGYDNVPDAPFRDSWDALAMKRMLRLAAEEGYDKIAWTSGEMQSKRYNIGNSIESLYVDQRPGESDRFVVARPLYNGDLIEFSFDSEGKITKGSLGEDSLEGKTLSDVFGKEVSQMILSSENGDNIPLHGKRIGGQGMNYFYDQKLVNWMNKYGKKWGVQVKDISLMGLENKDGWHSVDVTPEMKESVMQGQPMFRATEINQETREEMDKIEAIARINGIYLKAPNGADTKLSPEQWALVRTKTFKDWFGDWLKALRIEKLRSSKSAFIIGNEIAIGKDYKETRKNALEYGKTLRGEYANKDTGNKFLLVAGKNGGVKEILEHDYKDIPHLLSIAAIPQIAEESIYIDSIANEDLKKHPNIIRLRSKTLCLRRRKSMYL